MSEITNSLTAYNIQTGEVVYTIQNEYDINLIDILSTIVFGTANIIYNDTLGYITMVGSE